MDAPVVEGRKRVRRLQRELKEAVVKLVSEKVAPSGAKALLVTQRFKEVTRRIKSRARFNEAVLLDGMRQLSAGAERVRALRDSCVSVV
eukprot:9730731-Lingulodinium_polyedra.AAC.1